MLAVLQSTPNPQSENRELGGSAQAYSYFVGLNLPQAEGSARCVDFCCGFAVLQSDVEEREERILEWAEKVGSQHGSQVRPGCREGSETSGPHFLFLLQDGLDSI